MHRLSFFVLSRVAPPLGCQFDVFIVAHIPVIYGKLLEGLLQYLVEVFLARLHRLAHRFAVFPHYGFHHPAEAFLVCLRSGVRPYQPALHVYRHLELPEIEAEEGGFLIQGVALGAVEHDDRTGIFAECINCVSSVARFRAAFAGGGMVRSERFGVKVCHVETVVRTVQVDDLFSRLCFGAIAQA